MQKIQACVYLKIIFNFFCLILFLGKYDLDMFLMYLQYTNTDLCKKRFCFCHVLCDSYCESEPLSLSPLTHNTQLSICITLPTISHPARILRLWGIEISKWICQNASVLITNIIWHQSDFLWSDSFVVDSKPVHLIPKRVCFKLVRAHLFRMSQTMGLCESLQNGSSGLQTHRLLVVRNQSADSLLLIILVPNWRSKQGNNTVSHSLFLSLSYGGSFQACVILCHPS